MKTNFNQSLLPARLHAKYFICFGCNPPHSLKWELGTVVIRKIPEYWVVGRVNIRTHLESATNPGGLNDYYCVSFMSPRTTQENTDSTSYNSYSKYEAELGDGTTSPEGKGELTWD